MTKASVWLDLNFSPHIRDYNKTEGQELISTVEGQPVPCPWHTCSVRTAKWYSSRTTHPYTSWPALVIPVIVTETTPEWEIQVVSWVTHNGVVQPTLFFFLFFPSLHIIHLLSFNLIDCVLLCRNFHFLAICPLKPAEKTADIWTSQSHQVFSAKQFFTHSYPIFWWKKFWSRAHLTAGVVMGVIG